MDIGTELISVKTPRRLTKITGTKQIVCRDDGFPQTMYCVNNEWLSASEVHEHYSEVRDFSREVEREY